MMDRQSYGAFVFFLLIKSSCEMYSELGDWWGNLYYEFVENDAIDPKKNPRSCGWMVAYAVIYCIRGWLGGNVPLFASSCWVNFLSAAFFMVRWRWLGLILLSWWFVLPSAVPIMRFLQPPPRAGCGCVFQVPRVVFAWWRSRGLFSLIVPFLGNRGLLIFLWMITICWLML